MQICVTVTKFTLLIGLSALASAVSLTYFSLYFTCAEERRQRGKPRGEVLELLAQRAQQLGGSAAAGLRKLAAVEADRGMEAGAPTGAPQLRVSRSLRSHCSTGRQCRERSSRHDNGRIQAKASPSVSKSTHKCHQREAV